ncbi:hypothetical protein ACUIJP_08030 [Leuconostoc pseudomesenteroides]|uniref:hypothetical protein n=1 Tax=Leuconostoc pseudomesenteroides TaxID=33968 RepID=UPI00403E0C19
MTIDMKSKIMKSIGYINMISELDYVFNDTYRIEKLIPDDDYTSFDFRAIINIDKYTGIDIGVIGSGNSHSFQTGKGLISVGVSTESGFFILPSGK